MVQDKSYAETVPSWFLLKFIEVVSGKGVLMCIFGVWDLGYVKLFQV